MDKKLEAYRLRKRRKEKFDQIKHKLFSMIPLYQSDNSKEDAAINTNKERLLDDNVDEPLISELESDYVSEEDDVIFEQKANSVNPVVPSNKFLKYVYWTVLFLFWATCYAIAIELKFGIVYLMLSGLFGIYFNTRTRPKEKGEISAYSVFNKNCESIDGTLKAEQFENEIRYGPIAVR